MEDKASPSTVVRYRIEIKISGEQKKLITEAAAAARQGISEFVRNAAEHAARDLLSKRYT